MLTTDATKLQLDVTHHCWVIEFDLEHGHVATFGPANVYPSRDGRGQFGLESESTGGAYTEPSTVGEVQTWHAEDHVLAIFPTEHAMRAGASELIIAYGGALPHGVHHVLTAP
jgi:hypothetical protein